jgi:hypothetical protein
MWSGSSKRPDSSEPHERRVNPMAARSVSDVDEPTRPKPKPRSDAYTGMLAVSLIALLTGCALLYLDYKRYPNREPAPIKSSTATAPTPPAPTPPGR